MIKRLSCVLLVVLLATALSACGQTGTPPAPPTGQETPENKTKETAEADETAETDETAKPEADETAETDETAKPEADETAETDETAKPEADKTAETDETAKPEADKTAETDETAKPEADKTAETDETAEPEAKGTAEADETAEPKAKGTAEADETAEPEADETAKPEGTTKPKAKETAEADETAEPEADETAKPEADETTEPAGTKEPEATKKSGSGATKGTIKIASQCPLSGPQAALGTGIKNGAELGVAELSQPLKDLGFSVELVPFDDEAQPEKGSANANNIVSDPDILCVDGHYNSGVALAALPTYKSSDLLMVSPANTNPKITEDFENAYRIVGRDDVQGAVGEKFARETLKVKTVYIIHDKTDYGQGIAEVFRKSALKNGLKVLGFEGTEEKSVFDSILTPIQALNPDLIYFGGIYSQAGPLFLQARERGLKAEFMGPDGLDSADLLKLGSEAVAGMHYTTVAGPVSRFPKAAKFMDAYKKANKESAPPFSAQGYDAAGLCLAAITKAAEDAGNKKPTPKQVLAAMRTLPIYNGITGDYEFGAKGDPKEATYYVLKVDAKDWDKNELATELKIAPPK